MRNPSLPSRACAALLRSLELTDRCCSSPPVSSGRRCSACSDSSPSSRRTRTSTTCSAACSRRSGAAARTCPASSTRSAAPAPRSAAPHRRPRLPIARRVSFQVLDYSRLQSGVQDLEQIEFDLRDLVEEALDAVAARAQRKDLVGPDPASSLLPPNPDGLPPPSSHLGAQLRHVRVGRPADLARRRL